jgi:hypothetical protein
VAAPTCTAFRLSYPADRAADLLDAWQHSLPGLDEATALSLTITAPAQPKLASRVTVLGAAADGAAVDLLRRRLAQQPSADDRSHDTSPAVKRWLAPPEGIDLRSAYLHSESSGPRFPHSSCSNGSTNDRQPDPAKNANSISPPGAAPTTSRRPTRRRSPTATPDSYSNRPPPYGPAGSPAGGSMTPTNSPTPTAPAAPIPISPSPNLNNKAY